LEAISFHDCRGVKQFLQTGSNESKKVFPNYRSFRISEATKGIFVGFLMLTATTALTSINIAIVTSLSLAWSVAAISSVAFLVLLLIKACDFYSESLPFPLKTLTNITQAIVSDIKAVIAMALIFPIDYTRFDPKPDECDPNQTPILMIHGFLGSSNNFCYHHYHAKKLGIQNLFTINLGSPFHSLEHYAKVVEEKVLEIKAKTGRDDIIFYCHSMGGLVALQYLEQYAEKNGMRVRDILSMGSPYAGTLLANNPLAVADCARQMRCQSFHVNRLQERSRICPDTRFYHLATFWDGIIQPVSSAVASGAPLERRKEDWLSGTGHAGYLTCDTAVDYMLYYLKARLATYALES